MALLCLSLTGPTLEENRRRLKELTVPIDLIELRADFLKAGELEALDQFPGTAGAPVILTIRRTSDGGRYDGPEEERQAVIVRALKGGFSFLDLERGASFPRAVSSCRERGTVIIRSFHDFDGVPDNLDGLMEELSRDRDAVPKIAVTPGSTGDLLRLLETARRFSPVRKIVIAMGDWGVPSRILAEKFGSMLSYSSSADTPAAPGHLTPESLQNLYGYSSIDSETEVS